MIIKYKWKLKIKNFKYYTICNTVFDVQNIYTINFAITMKAANNNSTFEGFVRECNHLSTGVILLADIIPGLLIKTISPFFALYIKWVLPIFYE